jgi:hypothetical protein
VKHTIGDFHESPILLLSHIVLLRSIRDNVLPIDAIRAKNLTKVITNVFSYPIRFETLDLLLFLNSWNMANTLFLDLMV